jgi:hypothetical protein
MLKKERKSTIRQMILEDIEYEKNLKKMISKVIPN